jgi:DNA-binding transcriptional MerR regulator
MRIGEVSEKYGLSEDTLRYYEKIGLLDPTAKVHGIRDYSEKDIERLEFVKCMRDAGVSIEALQKYLELFKKGPETAAERKALLIEQRKELLTHKELIEKSIAHLDYKIAHYDEFYGLGGKKK